ncbi:hypothetical protein B7P43_G07185 [Cryptotermes secundus]|uniref:Mitochondrial thiamine pyrophosphate carrier n=1 Tax=Cryptotermes secundus TaxID=105785 RepID=A0A2J7PJN7_9NEOP|nr:hypothetical protein B7P43_G07185 [Cryptotermes secundus]
MACSRYYPVICLERLRNTTRNRTGQASAVFRPIAEVCRLYANLCVSVALLSVVFAAIYTGINNKIISLLRMGHRMTTAMHQPVSAERVRELSAGKGQGSIVMVGFDPEAKKKLSKGEHGMAGAISGGLTRFLCQPFDVIKIRFQLQVEPLSHACREAKYWSVSQAAHRIVKEEGFSALWKGHVPAQVLSIVYGVVQFASFEVLTQQTWYLLPHFRGDVYRPAVHFVCGGIAGTLATVFSFPSDVVRTRLVAQGDQKVYRSIPKALTTIYTAEGPRAFFKGLSPTLIQIAPHTGAQFACYSILTTVWKDLVQPKGETEEYVYVSGTGSLVCGSLAGIGAKIFVYPLDVARKRLQIQGFQHGRVGFGKLLKNILKYLEISVCGIGDSDLLQLQHGQLNSVLGNVRIENSDARSASRVRCMDDERLNVKCVGYSEGFIAI